jgi:hypothetical protein
MRPRTILLTAVAIWACGTPCQAQAPTGTISGHVISDDGKALPGVTVSVMSSALQGVRTAVSSDNGDYLVPLLPPGDYTLSYEMGSFQTVREVRGVAGNQTAMVDVKMSPAAVSESVTVVGSAQPFVETALVATSFKQDLMATLPSNRTIDAVLLMAPALHPTGPRGAYTIAGAQSYENLFTLNGAIITENLRGAPFTLYIEDALQETTVATAGISAEYGRFEGGVANAITKSGGNIFSGSFRTSFANDSWRSLTPYETAQTALDPTRQNKLDKVVPTYEATAGGPLRKDRLWYFGALRAQTQQSTKTTSFTNIPYPFTNEQQRYEGKLTYALRPGHSLQAFYTKINQVLKNNTGSTVMDLRSLTAQGQPQDLSSVHYTAVLGKNLFVEAQYSARHLSFTGVGSSTTDRTNGTMILDVQRNARFWSPTFCSGAVCSNDEGRNNSDAIVKGSYFLSSKTGGSHHMVFGYDRFDDNIWANTHASGSDYRIRATSSLIRGTEVFPQFIPGTTQIEWDPINQTSQGSHLRTHSAFINDTWRAGDHFSFNLGLRLDKNQASNGAGDDVGNKASLSPRLSAIWDPTGNAKWALTGSYARYVMALTSNLAGSTTAAGNSATYRWTYTGPAINGDPAAATSDLLKSDVALTQIFEWFDANGGNDLRPYALTNLPGVTMKMKAGGLNSPYAYEYAGGVSRTIGARATVRVDGTYRQYKNFYSLRTDGSTGQTKDALGNSFDLSIVENTDVLKRRYAGMVTQATYNVSGRLDLGGNYTLSRAYGNLEGETVNGGPSGANVLSYPEYKQQSWNAPDGDLLIDQRHRARIWATYAASLRGSGALVFGLVQQMGSGTPYGAVGQVRTGPFVTNPGYLSPPTTVDYYFTARDAFHTKAQYRTDVSVNYRYRLAHTAAEPFIHVELLNLFNRFQLCGCGASVFNNGGITDLTTINQSVAVIAATPFNPFTAQPVETVNWNKSTAFGTALNAFAYTSPRIFRFSVGVKF